MCSSCHAGFGHFYTMVVKTQIAKPNNFYEVWDISKKKLCVNFNAAIIDAVSPYSIKDKVVCGDSVYTDDKIKISFSTGDAYEDTNIKFVFDMGNQDKYWFVQKDEVNDPTGVDLYKIGNVHAGLAPEEFNGNMVYKFKRYNYAIEGDFFENDSNEGSGQCIYNQECSSDGWRITWQAQAWLETNEHNLGLLNKTMEFNEHIIDLNNKYIRSINKSSKAIEATIEISNFVVGKATWTNYECSMLSITCTKFEGNENYFTFDYTCLCDTDQNVPLKAQLNNTLSIIDYLKCDNITHTINTDDPFTGPVSVGNVLTEVTCDEVITEIKITNQDLTRPEMKIVYPSTSSGAGMTFGTIALIIAITVITVLIASCCIRKCCCTKQ